MAIPSYELLLDLVYGDRYYAQMMHTSGVISVYLLVMTMAVTPIALLLKRVPSGIALARWLLARRRYFGLGSFYYTALHLIHYIRQINDIENMLYEALDFELAIAWIAFLIFTALAITSNDTSVRGLKANWKKLHQLIYPAAVLTFLHWYLFDFFPDDVLTWAAILAALKLGHWGYKAYRKRDGLHTSAGLIKTPPR
jgi:sulfoxide reductase heme-binding subunit YedZ